MKSYNSTLLRQMNRSFDDDFLFDAYIERELADIVPSENPRCLLLGVDSHSASANCQEYASRTRLVLTSAQPIEVSVERRLQQHRLPDVLQLCLLSGEPTVLPVLGCKHGEHVRLKAHLRAFETHLTD